MSNRTLLAALSLVQTKLIFFALAFLALIVPFSLGNSQLITGTVVNAALFLSAVFLPGKLFLPIIVFPSLGVIARGWLFGPLTPLLFYFSPFIWLANLSLVLVFKRVSAVRGSFPALFLAVLIKGGILFTSASLFFQLEIVPRPFLKIMGVNQLGTALLGGLAALLFLKQVDNGKS